MRNITLIDKCLLTDEMYTCCFMNKQWIKSGEN